MDSNISIFNNDSFGEIRIVMQDDEKGTHQVRTPGGTREMTIVSEFRLADWIRERREFLRLGRSA